MEDAMVTGRMSAKKKAAGARVLAKEGLNASQAINMLYDKLEEDQDARILTQRKPEKREWESALHWQRVLSRQIVGLLRCTAVRVRIHIRNL